MLHARKHYTPGDMAEVQSYLHNHSTCNTLMDDLKIGFRVARLAKKHLEKSGGDMSRYKEFKSYLGKTKRAFKKSCKR
jgi:hypothetical protein